MQGSRGTTFWCGAQVVQRSRGRGLQPHSTDAAALAKQPQRKLRRGNVAAV